MISKYFSQEISVFHGRKIAEPGRLVGYGSIIEFFEIKMPLPNKLAFISEKRRQYTTEAWIVLTPKHRPLEDLYSQLVFALKYEGINLLFFKKLFEKIENTIVESWIIKEPLSQYSRRIWFLYEWLTDKKLALPDLKEGNYAMLVNEKLQYAVTLSTNSSRHRIKNNLPGSKNFCPLIF